MKAMMPITAFELIVLALLAGVIVGRLMEYSGLFSAIEDWLRSKGW